MARQIETIRARVPQACTIPADALSKILSASDDKTLPESLAKTEPKLRPTHRDLREDLSRQSKRLDRLKQVKLSSSWKFGDTQRQHPKGWASSATIDQLQERLGFVAREIDRLKRLPDLNEASMAP